jgi:hypothetical protein
MTSNEEVIETKVVRLVETNNFDFWIIAIRDSMQRLERTHFIRHGKFRCLVGSVKKSFKYGSVNWTYSFTFGRYLEAKINSYGKVFNMKVLRFCKMNNFVVYQILI